jgi:hypothetical protein
MTGSPHATIEEIAAARRVLFERDALWKPEPPAETAAAPAREPPTVKTYVGDKSDD